jgi:hypothetical protein
MEPSRPENSEDALQWNVRRMQAAISQAEQRHAACIQSWMSPGAWPMSHRQWGLARQLARQGRREDWKRRRGPAWAPAIVFFTLGLWFLSTASQQSAGDPSRWLGLGFILGAVAFLLRIRGRGRERHKGAPAEDVQQDERPPLNAKQSPQETRAEPDRTEALCEKLIREIRASSPALREVLHRPEETISSLRKACAALRERESSLRALVTAEDNVRLDAERAKLAQRIQLEADEVVRDRLSSALKSLEDQVRQRSNLLTSAARLEAERTRIHYALENLYTQVLSVKSADSASEDVSGAGLRRSLSRLSDEVSAVAESLEAVSRGDETLVTPVSPASSETSFPKPADREKS